MQWSRLGRVLGLLSILLPAGAVFASPAGAPEQGGGIAAPNLRISTESDTLARIHQANLSEIEVGLLASQKASSSDVKDYALMVLRDHQLADQKLVTTALAAGLSWAHAGCPDSRLQRRESGELVGMQRLFVLSGSDFDRAFLQMMVDDHKLVIGELTDARQRSNEAAVRDLISALLPGLQHHQQQAEKLLKQL